MAVGAYCLGTAQHVDTVASGNEPALAGKGSSVHLRCHRLPWSLTNSFLSVSPPQVLVATGASPISWGVTQMLGQECWRWGCLGYLCRECALIEVGQMFYIFSIPACSPSLGGTYNVEPETGIACGNSLRAWGCWGQFLKAVGN